MCGGDRHQLVSWGGRLSQRDPRIWTQSWSLSSFPFPFSFFSFPFSFLFQPEEKKRERKREEKGKEGKREEKKRKNSFETRIEPAFGCLKVKSVTTRAISPSIAAGLASVFYCFIFFVSCAPLRRNWTTTLTLTGLPQLGRASLTGTLQALT